MRHDDSTLFEEAFWRQYLMGPNCLRLAEEILQRVDISRARRILDLGCGMGLTSLYLAQRSPARIFAYDLWIDASDNDARFRQHRDDDRIIPIHGQAEALPFARQYFDVLFSMDAYMYFGDRDGFLENALTPFLTPGAVLAIVVPGLKKDFTDGVPPELRPFWQDEMHMYSFAWWEDLFTRSSAVRLEECFSLSCHDAAWRDWLSCDHPYAVRDRDMMRAEGGNYFDTIGLVARVV